MRRLGLSVSTLAAASSVALDAAVSSAELWRKLIPWMTPVNFATALGTSSGQPSASSNPLAVSFSLGHRSGAASAMPSPSVSDGGAASEAAGGGGAVSTAAGAGSDAGAGAGAGSVLPNV